MASNLNTMQRILTGIQSSGKPHLGNIMGAILPAIRLSKSPDNECLFFIADLHALTTVREPTVLRENNHAVVAAWMAFDFDFEKHILFQQSRVPIVAELAWMLGCITPFPMLANAHSFKDKSDRLADVNAGLFTYPVLMACDIILYDVHKVPVGKDQIQHLEICRDIASKFNSLYGETFVLPEAMVNEQVMIVPGTDGQKMSKSYGNTIDIFQDDKSLKKNIMSIVTDSTPLEEPKNPDTCNVFKLYSLMATPEQTEALRNKYLQGGFGYGHAKNELYELIVQLYEEPRRRFKEYYSDKELLEKSLQRGSDRAHTMAEKKITEVRMKIGLI